jgi:hypothetical protein
MATIAYPTADLYRPASFEWGEQRIVRVTGGTPLGPSEQTIEAPYSHRWRAIITLRRCRTFAERAQVEAFVSTLKSGANRLSLHHMAHPRPYGTLSGSPTLSASHAQGATTVSITAGEGQTLVAGDMIGVTTTAGVQLVRAVSSGAATTALHNMLIYSEQVSPSLWGANDYSVVANAIQRPDSTTVSHNLVKHSQDLSNAAWEVGPNLTANGADGSLMGVQAWRFTSAAVGNSYVAQSVTGLIPGAVYTATYLCDVNAGGAAYLRIDGPNAQLAYTVTQISAGVFRYSCTFTYPTSGATGVLLLVGRVDAAAGVSFRTTAVQLNLGPDVLPYAPTAASAIAPTNATGEVITSTGTFGGPGQAFAGVAGVAYTASAWMKAAPGTSHCYVSIYDGTNGGEAWFNLTTGAVSTISAAYGNATSLSAGIESAGGGWYRCWFTARLGTTATTGAYFRPAAATNTASANNDRVYVWGAQVVQGSDPLAYTATTTAAVGTPGVVGPLSVAIEPALRAGASSGAAVVWDKPTALFRLASPDWSAQFVPGEAPPITLEFVEVTA